MIQNDRRRTNAAVDQILVVNRQITTPIINTLDLTVLRNFTLGPDVVFNGASTINTNTITTNDIKTNTIQTTTLDATTINTTTVNTDNITTESLTSQRLRLLANTTQIKVGSANEVVLDIDTSSNRTIGVTATAGNANVVLTESAQTINGVKTFTDMVVFLSSFTLASLTLSALTNQLTLGTGNQITLSAPTPAASRTYTMPDVLANANFIMSEGAQTLNGVKTFSATAVFLAGFSLATLTLSALTNQLTLGTGNQITVNAPTPAASRTYTMPDVLANANFIMSEGAQTLNGVKTFSATAVFLAGFSLASITLSAVSNQITLGAGNQIILTAPTPAATRTYTIPDVLANASFVMTEGSQSISGAKMFFNNITFDANLLLDNTSVIAFTKPTNQMTFTSAGTSITLNLPAPAANRIYTVPDVLANANFIMSEGAQTMNGAKTFSTQVAITAAANQLVLRSGNTVTIHAAASGGSRIYTLDDILVNASFVMNNGTQTIDGSKTFLQNTTFDSSVLIKQTSLQLVLGTGTAIILTAPTPAATRIYTMTDVLANANFIMSEGAQTINGTKTFTSAPVFPALSFASLTLTNATNQLTFGSGNTTTISSVAPAASRTYTVPDAGGAASFVMTDGTQTLNGAKTFSSALIDTALTNQLILGGATTITLNAPAPAASRTYTMPDVLANANFVMTEGTQTINGAKTFSSIVTFNGGFSGSATSITLTAATNQIVLGTGNTTTITSPAPAASRIYTILDVGAAASFVMTSGNYVTANTLNGDYAFTNPVRINSASVNQLQFNSNTTPISINVATPAAPRQYSIVDVLGNANFIMSEGTQTINGAKTMTNATISFPTSGGTPTALTYYEELFSTITILSAFQNPGVTTNIYYLRIGRLVTVQIEGFLAAINNSPATGHYDTLTAIPSQFRPIKQLTGRMTSRANSAILLGTWIAKTTGFIEFDRTVVSGADVINNDWTVPPNGLQGLDGMCMTWISA